MAKYTLLTRGDIDAVAGEYGLQPTAFRCLHGGVENTTYVVNTASEDWVFAVLEKRSFDEAAAYAAYLAEVTSKRMPAPALRRTTAGRALGQIAGKPVVVSRYIEGEHLHPLPDRQLHDVGAIVGRLHISGAQCGLPPHVRISPAIAAAARTMGASGFSRWFARKFAEVGHPFASGPRVATHGDLYWDNILVTPQGATIIIDWEDGALDSPLVDLASAVLGLCCQDQFAPTRLTTLLKGYVSTCPFRPDPDDLLRASIYFALFAAYNRYRRARKPAGDAPLSRGFEEIPRLVESVEEHWGAVDWSQIR